MSEKKSKKKIFSKKEARFPDLREDTSVEDVVIQVECRCACKERLKRRMQKAVVFENAAFRKLSWK